MSEDRSSTRKPQLRALAGGWRELAELELPPIWPGWRLGSEPLSALWRAKGEQTA